jgi:phosphoglycolate phosphatase
MTQKTIIFDFDGTIADTFSVLLNIYNDSAARFNSKQVKGKDIEKLRSQRPQQFLKEYGVTGFKAPMMALYIKRQLTRHLLEISVVPGMDKAIKQLKGNGNKIGILTSNSKPNVELFLQQNSLIDYFDFICTSKNIFRKDRALMKVVKNQHLNRADVIYVGDETRDIEACKRVSIKIIAVTWGFNSEQILKATKPDCLVEKPSAICNLLK